MLRLAAACAALGGVLALDIAVPVDGNDFLVSLRDGLPPSEMASEARIGARAVIDALRDAGGLGGGCPADDRDCLVEIVAGYIAAREDATRVRWPFEAAYGGPVPRATFQFVITALAAHGVRGGLVEIGAKAGKSFLALLEPWWRSGMGGGGVAVAIDVWGDQDANPDRSGWGGALSDPAAWGAGNRAMLEEHVAAAARAVSDDALRDAVVLLEHSSLDLAPAALRAAAGGEVAVFSVDGCHTFACARSDLELAWAVLAPRGVVVVDDYVASDEWPGVSFAVGAFLAAHADAVPVAYGARRLYLARAPAAPLLFQIFRSFCGATAARRRVDVDSVCTTRAGTGPGGADVLFVRDGADPGSL